MTNFPTHLVVPTISAGPDLDTAFKFIRPAQEVTAELRKILWRRVVEAHNEERVVYDLQARRVRAVTLKRRAQCRPGLALLSREHPNRAERGRLRRSFVRVATNRMQVAHNLALREQRPVFIVQNLEPVWNPA
jgi:hypothetical protein